MSRTLRPRKSRPSYSLAFELDDDDLDSQPVAGPSKKTVIDYQDSESDFSPEKEPHNADPDEDENADLENDEFHDSDDEFALPDESLAAAAVSKARSGSGSSKSKAKGPTKAKKVVFDVVSMPSLGSGSGIARTSKRQIYILPTPSVHHRHRAVPLYSWTGRVERLAAQPILFGPQMTAPTNNFTH